MTDADLRASFASTTRHGRRPPEDAYLEIERDEHATRLCVSWTYLGRNERHGCDVSHLVAIRQPGESPDRNPREVEREVQRAVVGLALFCIDATPPLVRSRTYRPFVARPA